MSSEQNTPRGFLPKLRNDALPSIVVFLVALPLCMGISIASGVPVAAGLVTGIIGGLVVGFLAGAPLQVSGPAAGLTVVVYDLVSKHGLESLGIVVLMAGSLQLVAGLFRLGQWFRAVSPAVIKGMLAGIGVLIFASQFHVMVDDKPQGNGLTNLITIPSAIEKGLPLPKFGSREERAERTAKLQDFGTLHNQQVEIREEVGEVVPEFVAHELTESDKERLTELAARQKALHEKLEKLASELDAGAATKTEESAQKLRDATQAALSASSTALQNLEDQNVAKLRESQAEVDARILGVEAGLKNHGLAAKLGLLTILLIILWQTVTPKNWRIVPAPLIAVVAATLLAVFFVLPVLYVEVPPRLLDDLHVPKLAVLTEGDWSALLQAAVVIAIVASAETLLCATAVDQMHQGKRAKYNRELCAQGAGNMVCGLFGALPMTGVIVRSAANVQSGGQSRWSAIMHGLWLLIFVVFLTALIRLIPVAALAAMLVYTGYKLVDFKSIRLLAEYGKGEVVIYFATVGTIVAMDLLTGVLVGISLSAGKLLLTVSRLTVDISKDKDSDRVTVQLHGTATFLQLPILAGELEKIPRHQKVRIVEENLLFIDHACLDLIISWSKQYQLSGGEVKVDLEQLHDKYRQPAKTPAPEKPAAKVASVKAS